MVTGTLVEVISGVAMVALTVVAILSMLDGAKPDSDEQAARADNATTTRSSFFNSSTVH